VRARGSGGKRRFGFAGAVSVVVLAGCGTSATVPSATGTTRPPGSVGTTAPRATSRADFAGQVDLGNGRSIYLECRGSGGPTVVLVTGLGERADNWMTTSDTPPQPDRSVFPGVAKVTRVCAYDRPGTATAKSDQTGFDESRSTAVAQPATVQDSAVDLDALLTASGEPGPYVLVGHSLGGPIVRLYAGAHPTQVAGIVLVDALSEDVGDGLTAAQRESFAKLNDPTAQGRPAGSERDLYAEALVPQLRAAPPAPKVPVIVLTADTWIFTADVIAAGQASGQLPSYVTQEFTDALWVAQIRAQNLLAAKFPGAKHVTDTHASHYIHLDNPQLVIDSIRAVVEQVRAGPPG
jgi:pimeloyl-ACP methyl ester carboxylesterase